MYETSHHQADDADADAYAHVHTGTVTNTTQHRAHAWSRQEMDSDVSKTITAVVVCFGAFLLSHINAPVSSNRRHLVMYSIYMFYVQLLTTRSTSVIMKRSETHFQSTAVTITARPRPRPEDNKTGNGQLWRLHLILSSAPNARLESAERRTVVAAFAATDLQSAEMRVPFTPAIRPS